MIKEDFFVTGMTCTACVGHVEKAVQKLDGVKDVNVSLMTNSMSVSYDDTRVTEALIVDTVDKAGYTARPKQSAGTQESAASPRELMEKELQSMKQRAIVSIVLLVVLMYVSMFHMLGLPGPAIFMGTENALIFAFTQFLLTLPILYINRSYYSVGLSSLFRGTPNMDSLIAIGSGAALVYGVFAIYRIGYGLGHGDLAMVDHYRMNLYFESAAMIVALITLGKYLETRSKGKTSEAIEKMMDLAPKTAFVMRNGEEVEVLLEDVVVGDIVVIRPGASIPVDGQIVEGSSTIDEAALTGESIPVEKMVGDRVSTGTINKTGYFQMEAQNVGDDTTLAQMIRLVEEASASKAPISKMADKVAGVFVPIVIIIAIVATVVWLLLGSSAEFAISIGISVLVISCPCALGLATPVAIMVGTGKGAEHGILIKSAEALETAHHTDVIVMDKTGTITVGKPAVTDIVPYDISEEELMAIAASLEAPSEHPLAEAIMQYASTNNIALEEIENFEAIPGKGLKATIQGQTALAGNIAMMNDHEIQLQNAEETAQKLAQNGKTPLYFARDGKVIGVVAVADIIKPTSKEAVSALHDMGIEVIMLTGDNELTAEAIRNMLHIEKAYSEVLPQDKERIIREIQAEGKKVAMVGDGINDAPALARADVGIAIGAGTDIAIESADIVLVKSDLLDAVTAIQLSKAVIRNIKQNLFWAFFYNSLGIPLAAGVFVGLTGWTLNPMFAAAAMSLSSIFVVTNALRLKAFKPKYHTKNLDEQSILAKGSEIHDKMSNQHPIIEKKEKVDTMEKTITIEGMTCEHCSGRVEKALNELPGVAATVDLSEKTAHVKLSDDVSDDTLRTTVEEAGYEVTLIK